MNVAAGHHERGAGAIASTAGVLVFLVLMLAAVQVMFDLYATSMVTAAAHDAAREVAGVEAAADRCGRIPDAERNFVEALGDYARQAPVTLRWTCTGTDIVAVRVTAEHPTLIPGLAAGLLPLARVDRTIEIRLEQPR